MLCLLPSARAAEQSPPDPKRPVAVLVLDVEDNGLQLAGVQDGVRFDIDNTGKKVPIGWTAAGSDDGFVVLAPGPAGITSGSQLLGNGWLLPSGSRVFSVDLAILAAKGIAMDAMGRITGEFPNDMPAAIRQEDEVFSRLRLWVDRNHNGISEASELSTFASVGITRIHALFTNGRDTDKFGNVLGPSGSFALERQGVSFRRVMRAVQFGK